MSSYQRKLKNPKTGKMQIALCIDDYFAPRVYGFGFRKDGKDANIINGFNEEDFEFYKFDEKMI